MTHYLITVTVPRQKEHKMDHEDDIKSVWGTKNANQFFWPQKNWCLVS